MGSLRFWCLKGWCVILVLALWGTTICAPLWAQDGNGQASILNPITSKSQTFSFTADAIDPPAGFQGDLAIYTPASGAVMPESQASVSAVVKDQMVTSIGTGSVAIPANGFVLSGHGSAAQWLVRFAKPGAVASYDAVSRQVTIQHTPQVYLSAIDAALEKAQLRPPASPQAYAKSLQQAQTCRTQLATQATSTTITPTFLTLAEQCLHEAERAFYASIPSYPGEFRGTWLRPNSTNPEQIRQMLATLKQLGIQNIFLETYYQGRTAYPSDVMQTYGLPAQHMQFVGSDPVQLWVDEAHKAGLKVHFWVEVFFAGNNDENPEPYGPILQKYPQWRNVQQRHWNESVPVISDVEPGHFFLDPANPEVRTFLEKLLLEMVTRYEADGLNLDYIRYPASAAMSKANYLNSTWGYTDTARKTFETMIQQERAATEAKKREAFQKAHASSRRRRAHYKAAVAPSADPVQLTPSSPLWQRWVEWRKSWVTGFVKNISEKAHAVRPNLLLSAVVFPSTDPLYSLKLQDYSYWAKQGYIQALTPIGLSPRPDWMQQQSLKLKQQVEDRIPVYVGVFGMYNRATPVEFLEQIDAVHQAKMPGIMLFEWSRLRPEYAEALKEGPFRE